MRKSLFHFRIPILVVAVVLIAGGANAVYWSSEVGPGYTLSVPRVLLALAVCTIGLPMHLALRWLRWHWLLRGDGRNVPTRYSASVFLATMLAFFTPFHLGELVRAWPLRRFDVDARHVVRMWLVERLCDLAVVLPFAILARGPAVALAVSGLLWTCAWFVQRPFSSGDRGTAWRTCTAPVLTLGIWALPATALPVVVQLLGHPLTLVDGLAAWGTSALWGGVTGTQVSAMVAGSVLTLELQELGVTPAVAVLATAVFRVGTVWFCLALAAGCALHWGRKLHLRGSDAQEHFDEIAGIYDSLIPSHVRERLLNRKTHAMREALRNSGIGPGARGLDVGCGSGGYLNAMARAGYHMTGVDRSQGQVDGALRQFGEAGVVADVRQAEALALPFEDRSFDFLYLINVAHHITDPQQRQATFQELVRVLRPGGVMFMHEINTYNPLFRFYMGYVFPLLRPIDDGTEEWILPRALPDVPGASWHSEVRFFTFLPEFLPDWLLRAGGSVESFLERSRWRSYSAHFMATLEAGPRISTRGSVQHEPKAQLRSATASTPAIAYSP